MSTDNFWLDAQDEEIRDRFSGANADLQESQRLVTEGRFRKATLRLSEATVKIAELIWRISESREAGGSYAVQENRPAAQDEAGYHPTDQIYQARVRLEDAEAALADPGTSNHVAIARLAEAIMAAGSAQGIIHTDHPKGEEWKQ